MTRYAAALDHEWATLVTSPAGRRALMRWTAADDGFAGLIDLDAVLARGRDTDLRQSVLAALARLAPTDEVAARTLLQAMVGGLLGLANGATGNDDEDALQELVSLAWERIRTYPAGRPGPVGGNILLDVRKSYRAHRRALERPAECVDVDPEITNGINDPESAVLAKLLLADMISAERAGLISKPGLDAVVRIRLLCDTANEVGAETAVTLRTVNQWRRRAEARMRTLALAG